MYHYTSVGNDTKEMRFDQIFDDFLYYTEATDTYINSSSISVETEYAYLYLPVDKEGSSMVFDLELEITVNMEITVRYYCEISLHDQLYF